jgi:hypothetical protein
VQASGAEEEVCRVPGTIQFLAPPNLDAFPAHPLVAACVPAQHRMVDVIVTTAGGVEEDYIKARRSGGTAHQPGRLGQGQRENASAGPAGACMHLCHCLRGKQLSQLRCVVVLPRPPQCMAPTYVGDFQLKGADLRRRGLNRIGNMLVPNSNYCRFEDWVIPIFDAMLKEQQRDGVLWTPSKASLASLP